MSTEAIPAPRPGMSEDIEAFTRTYFKANPDATHVDLVNALRTPRGLPASTYELVKVCERLSPIPTLDTVDAAREFMARMVARGYEWVAVFWDRGWGDNGEVAEITVIQGGDGQIPLARVTPDVYRELLTLRVIAPNSLQTYKARRVHDFVAPAPTPESGETA